VVGLVGAIRWITLRGSEPWRPITWIGVALGLASALAIRFSGVLGRQVFSDLITWWPGTATFLAASGTLGGLVAGVAGARWGRREGTRSSERRTKRSPRSDEKKKRPSCVVERNRFAVGRT
jgi:hypothetical protein